MDPSATSTSKSTTKDTSTSNAKTASIATNERESRRKHVVGPKLPQYVYTVLVSIGALIIGTVLGWSSPSLKHLEDYNSPAFAHVRDRMESSLIAALAPIGAIFGGIPAGFMADYFGRRNTLINFTYPWILSWAMLCLSPFIILVHVGRFISGFICGLFCGVLPMYVAEISEDSIRGTLGMFFQTFLALGVLFIYSLGIFNSYLVINATGALVTFIYLLVLFRIPESPIHLCQERRYDEAEKSLKMLRGSKFDVRSEILRINKELLRRSSEDTPTMPKVYTKPNVKGVAISVSLMVIQQFTGINAMIFYGENILTSGDVPNAHVFISFIGLFSAITTVTSIFLVDKLGRRILLLISTIGMTFFSSILGFYLMQVQTYEFEDFSHNAWIPITSFTILIMSFGIGLGPIPWFMAAELMMPEIKKFGTGITVATSWAGTAIIIYLYTPFSLHVGTWYMFYMFSVIGILASFYIYFVVPETKGKSMKEIREDLGDKSFAGDSDNS